jgi:hypothetical protein
MLPIGSLAPSPGWGPPRLTRLTHAEQRTLITLWSMTRSPLMIGGNLTDMDAWTRSLLTNPEVLDVDQRSTNTKQLFDAGNIVVWSAEPSDRKGEYFAVFNRGATVQQVEYDWKDLGLEKADYNLRDLWAHENLGRAQSLRIELPGHGSAIYRVW